MINLNRLDLASLRLFGAGVDVGSLTAGADRFGISPTTALRRRHALRKRLLAMRQGSDRSQVARGPVALPEDHSRARPSTVSR